MRKVTGNISKVIAAIDSLKGQELKISINRGRNKIENYCGAIEETYPSVFIFNVKTSDKKFDSITKLSCSYQDVLCGYIKFAR